VKTPLIAGTSLLLVLACARALSVHRIEPTPTPSPVYASVASAAPLARLTCTTTYPPGIGFTFCPTPMRKNPPPGMPPGNPAPNVSPEAATAGR
jgi:hypothetical protein